MDKITKESLYYQVNKMIDSLTDRDLHTVELMLEGLYQVLDQVLHNQYL